MRAAHALSFGLPAVILIVSLSIAVSSGVWESIERWLSWLLAIGCLAALQQPAILALLESYTKGNVDGETAFSRFQRRKSKFFAHVTFQTQTSARQFQVCGCGSKYHLGKDMQQI